jgi:hypothetical protein
MKKPGMDSTALDAALTTFKAEQGLLERLEIIIQPYNIGPQ